MLRSLVKGLDRMSVSLSGGGSPSLSQTNVMGRSPDTTTHWTLILSPNFKSRANVKGVILGGTERYNKRVIL